MIDRLSRTMKKLDEVCSELSTQTGMNFLGIDCSIAPFPMAAALQDWLKK